MALFFYLSLRSFRFHANDTRPLFFLRIYALEILLAIATLAYIAFILGLAVRAKYRIHDETDFLAAGRKLSTLFAASTLFATWFGAGTLLTATDAIYEHGLAITALEPFGAGACLIFAGMFFAKPLWEMKILTVPDLFFIKFGKKAETLASLLLVPGYFGWIAVQITALSGILHMFFGLPVWSCMILVTLLATILASLGGMWSIALTDLVQMCFVGVVICILGYVVVTALGGGELYAGLIELWNKSQVEQEVSHIRSSSKKLFSIVNIFAIAALGNLPGQDLAQRVFSANSGKVAARACLLGGIFYIVFGSISILLGISARSLLPEVGHSVVPHLAKHLLSPGLTILLVVAIISIIMSTMDSAMLATASILAHNLFKRKCTEDKISIIKACRIGIVFVALCSLLLAFFGRSAYALLEQSYAITLAGLFAPFAIALYSKKGHEIAAIISMVVGTTVWCLGFFTENMFLSELAAFMASSISYYAAKAFFLALNRKNEVSKLSHLDALSAE